MTYCISMVCMCEFLCVVEEWPGALDPAEAGVIGGCKLPCECWELKSGPLEPLSHRGSSSTLDFFTLINVRRRQ